MLRTAYEEIVDVNAIGEKENTRDLNQILMLAGKEQLQPFSKNSEQVLVIGIDVQKDFMEKGSLAVPNSHGDVERFTRWIYNNLDNISKIAVSIDTHIPHQIFHPCWWIDKNGVNPPPFTPITLDDLDNGNWLAVIDPVKSRRYVEGLKKAGNKDLFIWTYHCIQGTEGCALENQFANIVYFWEVAKKSVPLRLVKGQDPYSEMYGIIKPEFDEKGYINTGFLNAIEKYDKVVIGGEASSHCVMESIRQILDYYNNRIDVTSKIYILEDCMSVIPGFEKITSDTFEQFKKKNKINIVKSTDLTL
jgi:nicotinamidase-related amidase